jgi:exodeoxyribonuclease VII small subunit
MVDDNKAMVNQTVESIEDLSYEEAYVRLQEMLVALESGDLPLEDSLQMYELGTRLAAHCAQKLEKAELRVRRWQDGGSTIPFDGWHADESN